MRLLSESSKLGSEGRTKNRKNRKKGEEKRMNREKEAIFMSIQNY